MNAANKAKPPAPVEVVPEKHSAPAPPSEQSGSKPSPPQLELVHAPKSIRPWLFLGSVILLGVVALIVTYFVHVVSYPSTNDAYIEGRVVRICPRVSGQVIALHVDDNTSVNAGDVLLEIDPADYQSKVDQARAAVSVAESFVQQSEAAVLKADATVGEAAAALGSAEAESKHRSSDYRRHSAMGTDGVSEQQLETTKTAADVSERQREVAEKKLAAANADLNVSKVNVATAQSQLAAAQAQLRFAALQLQYTKVLAPEAGAVTKRNVESGAFVSTAQPLMAIVPCEFWVIANFKEVQLERMRAGQAAEIRVDAFPMLRLRGRVQSIQAGTGSRFQLLPPENATGNWIKVVQRVPVKIVIDPGQKGIEMLALGMSVEVTVDVRGSLSENGSKSLIAPEGR